MDWLDLLAVQGTLKSLLQHHSSKAVSHMGLQKGNYFEMVLRLELLFQEYLTKPA